MNQVRLLLFILMGCYMRQNCFLLVSKRCLCMLMIGYTKTQDVETIKCTLGSLRKVKYFNVVAPADPIHISQLRQLPAQLNTR